MWSMHRLSYYKIWEYEFTASDWDKYDKTLDIFVDIKDIPENLLYRPPDRVVMKYVALDVIGCGLVEGSHCD